MLHVVSTATLQVTEQALVVGRLLLGRRREDDEPPPVAMFDLQRVIMVGEAQEVEVVRDRVE